MPYLLKELIDVDVLQQIFENFSKITKAATAILDLEGNILVATGWQDICTKFHRINPGTSCRCQESDTILTKQLILFEKYNVYKCKNGLVDVAVPIIVGEDHVGNLFTGQFFFEPPDKEYFRQQAIEFGFDSDSYLEALSRVPIFSTDQVKLTMGFLCGLAEFVGGMGLEKIEVIKANEILNKEIQNRQKVEKELRKEKEKFKTLTETSPLAIYILTGIEQKVVYINPTFTKLFGYTIKEVPTAEKWWPLAYPDEKYRKQIKEDWKHNVEKVNKPKSDIEPMETLVTCKDGSKKTISWEFINIGKQNWGFGLNLTEQKQAEEEKITLEKRLQQSQKMEAIGTLAGGIAHDFNNILSAILGYSQFVKEELPIGSRADKDIDMVIQSSIRAAELVKQILTFSRKTEHQLQPLTPHPIIKEALLMLRSTLPSTIEIKEDIDKECGNIEADPTNIHQIMINLCSNALHAMESQKGTLTVKLFRETLGTDGVEAYENVAPGSFVVLSISDTGHGMDTKTMQRIFEPYFTTKEVGKGSGIGLAVIHGIIQDSKGFVRVVSTPGQGSTFHVYLPLLEENSAAEDDQVALQKNEKSLPQENGRIILVDDEELLVWVNKRRLEYPGYTVTATTDSEEALEKIRAHPEQFDLLITDQTMPNMSGVELTREVHKIKPDMPVIMSTGHSDLVTKEEALKMGISKYVVKPIQGDELIDAVREVLGKK